MTAPPEPTTNYTAYRAACAEAASQAPAEWTFKSDPRYRHILEHVTAAQAVEFGNLAAETCADSTTLWAAIEPLFHKVCATNDQVGCPVVERIPGLDLSCSPSNLRYLCHAVMIWRHLERLGLKAVHIVELGGGYGGLALYLARLSRFFWPRLASHTSIDLPEVAALQVRYARVMGIRLRAVSGLDAESVDLAFHPDDGIPRYFISCYAFSEFDAETRAWYEHRVACRCAHGFLVWNFAQPLLGVAEKPLGGPLYPFVDAPLTVEPERPSTGPGNVVVRF